MVAIIGFFLYLSKASGTLSERALMNVGYGMIGVILMNFAVNLAFVLATSIGSLVEFCRKKKRRKRRAEQA